MNTFSHKLRRTLYNVAKPSRAALQQLTESDLQRLDVSKKTEQTSHPIKPNNQTQYLRCLQPRSRRRNAQAYPWGTDQQVQYEYFIQASQLPKTENANIKPISRLQRGRHSIRNTRSISLPIHQRNRPWSLPPQVTKRKASQNPESPQPSTTAAFKQPFLPIALAANEPQDINLSTSWTYDTGANSHVGNNIKHFINYNEIQPTQITTGFSSSAIHGYGNVKLSIQCGKRSITFTLRNAAYCPDFHTNLVCSDLLFFQCRCQESRLINPDGLVVASNQTA